MTVDDAAGARVFGRWDWSRLGGRATPRRSARWTALAALCALLTLAAVEPAWSAETHKPAPASSGSSVKPGAAHGGGGHSDGHGGEGHGGGHGHGGEAEEAAPETFIVLDLLSEAAEASVAGIGVKIAELNPKIKHINDLYKKGENDKANAKVLGIMTEVVLIGALIEVTGVGELFLTAISFAGNWAFQLAQSTVGILAITKTAVVTAETIEEAAEEKFAASTAAKAAAAKAAAAKKRKRSRE